MHFTKQVTTPGEHALLLQGEKGTIEAIYTIPEHKRGTQFALLGHPHSLQGGTMNNKVVTTLARVFKELGIPSIRFNFRGVGQSSGIYDGGIGESQDMIDIAQGCLEAESNTKFIFAGFSFGSYVTYRSAHHFPGSVLISIAPPVHHYDYKEFKVNFRSWLIIQGNEDEVVPCNLVYDFANNFTPPIPVIEFGETGHFFHGKLVQLKATVLDYLCTQDPSL